MRRLLVTGGAGFIGANFVRYWSSQHPEDLLTVLDSLNYAGNFQSLEPLIYSSNLQFIEGDIRDQDLVEDLLSSQQIDTVVHFAAESHVDRSIDAPDIFIDVNVVGTHVLLKAARKVWLEAGELPGHRFHHVSTDEVFGSLTTTDPPFDETSRYAPNSPYAASKAAADHLVRAYGETYGLQTTISNCSNNYGPYQHPEKLIPLSITNLLRGREIPLYGDGLNVRDWLYVDDHCRGLELTLDRGKIGRTYCFGGNCERTNVEVLEAICTYLDQVFADRSTLAEQYPDSWPSYGARCQEAIQAVVDRPGHDRRYAIDAQRARTELSYTPRVNFECGLHKTIDWYLGNPGWWQPLLA